MAPGSLAWSLTFAIAIGKPAAHNQGSNHVLSVAYYFGDPYEHARSPPPLIPAKLWQENALGWLDIPHGRYYCKLIISDI